MDKRVCMILVMLCSNIPPPYGALRRSRRSAPPSPSSIRSDKTPRPPTSARSKWAISSAAKPSLCLLANLRSTAALLFPFSSRPFIRHRALPLPPPKSPLHAPPRRCPPRRCRRPAHLCSELGTLFIIVETTNGCIVPYHNTQAAARLQALLWYRLPYHLEDSMLCVYPESVFRGLQERHHPILCRWMIRWLCVTQLVKPHDAVLEGRIVWPTISELLPVLFWVMDSDVTEDYSLLPQSFSCNLYGWRLKI